MTETTLQPPRFALFELAYLLTGRTDENSARSREIIGIPEVPEPEGVIFQAGLSGLITRGLITEDEVGLIPQKEAALLGMILATAQHWVSIAVRRPELVDLSLLVQGERASCLIRRAPGPTFDVVFIRPGEAIADAAFAIASNLLDEGETALMVRTASVSTESALFVQNTASDGWQLGLDPVFPDQEEWPAPDLEATAADRGSALHALRVVLDADRPAA